MMYKTYETLLNTPKPETIPINIHHLVDMHYIHKMEHYSTIKRNKVLIYVSIWMTLEDTMLSERSQM